MASVLLTARKFSLADGNAIFDLAQNFRGGIEDSRTMMKLIDVLERRSGQIQVTKDNVLDLLASVGHIRHHPPARKKLVGPKRHRFRYAHA